MKLEESFRFERPQPYFPGIFVLIEGIVGMLPQLGGVMISSEPDLQVPGRGEVGIAHTLMIPGRLPPQFPVGLPASRVEASISGVLSGKVSESAELPTR